jgi:8-oxo-dGTP pyrophosphatase MutT (NUDIX family)
MIREYEKSKIMFNRLKETILENLINKCDRRYVNPEWEFPKGRRSNRENNLKCAIREFEEETDLNRDEYILLENVMPISEEYRGSNGVCYKHIYYFAIYKGLRDLSINLDKYEQFSEIGDIQWFTADECYSKIRPENPTKNDIINKLNAFMVNWENDFIFKE